MADSKFQETLGLLLGHQVADGLNIGDGGAGIRSRHQGRRLDSSRRQRGGKVEPSGPGNFKARNLITCAGGKDGEQNQD